MQVEVQDHLKNVGDALSVGTVIATIAGWLPSIAALVTIIWTGIRIYETDTIRNLIKRFRGGQ